MSDLTGIIRGLEPGPAALRDTAPAAAPKPVESVPLAAAPSDRSVVAAESGYGPHSFAFDTVPPVLPPAGDDALAGAMRDAVGPDPTDAFDAASVAGLLNQYTIPSTPTTRTLHGAAALIQALFGHKHPTLDLVQGGSLKAEDVSGSILDQSTGRFTT